MKQFQTDDLVRIEIDHTIVTAKVCLVALNGCIVEFMKQGKKCLDFVTNENLVPA